MRTSPGSDPHATLAELDRLAPEAGCPEIAAEARALDERLAEGRFFVMSGPWPPPSCSSP